MRHLGTKIFMTMLLICLVTSTAYAQIDSAEQSPITFENLARVSYDDRYVATVSADDLGMSNSTIWVAKPDGSERLAVARSGADFWVTNPIWSPNTNELAYLKVLDVAEDEFSIFPAFELWAVKADGSGNRLLTDSAMLNPALGYGGKADIEWNEQGEILFTDNSAYPMVRYALHVASGELRKVGESTGALGDVALGGQPSNVPYFNQCDSRWKNNRLGTCSSTICRAGCAMSSVAMILKYYRASVDPARLNSWLTSRGGYASGCLIYWGAAANYHSGTKYITHVGWQDWNRLRAELNAGYPVIVNVKNGGHWVVVTHYSGGTYYINDPGYSSRKTLASYGNRFSRMIIYHGTRPSPTPPAPTPTPKITGVSPNPMRPLPVTQRQPMTISGSGFVSGAKLLFKIVDSPSYSYPNRVPSSLSSSKIVYNISVGPNIHNWTVQVINPDGKKSNIFPFRVEPASSNPTPAPSGTGVVPVYRKWSQSRNDHLYTTDPNEGKSSGYVDEGILGYLYPQQVSGTVPIYRRWHSGKLDHFYTTSSTEGLNIGYVNQGILGYAYPSQKSGTVPVYRQFHFRKNDHFYTADRAERDMARDVIGYVDEGILAYFFSQSHGSLRVTKSGSGSGTVSGSGISCGSDCSESYRNGLKVTLTAVPASGHVFSGWQGACGGTGSTCNVTMLGDRRVAAVFNQKARTINASAAEGGIISPSGNVSVPYGSSKSFTITPKTGHKVAKLIVDGQSLSGASSYTFTNVTGDHSIRAYFERVTHTITASAASGGSISPAGESVVTHDGSQSYTIQADAGYEIADVKVDGVSIGAKTSYVFEHIMANHTIEATFKVVAAVGLLLDQNEGKAGSAEHPVQIALNNPATAVSSLQFRVTYDATTGLRAIGGASGYRLSDRAQGFSVNLSVTENGANSEVLVLLYDFSGGSISAGSGAILDLLFQIDAGATPGDVSPLTFSEGIAADAAAQSMAVTIGDTGSVTILDACDRGDVNCDGSVNVLDVQSLLNCISGSGSCERCDLNDDGQQNVIDVQVLVNIINNVSPQTGSGALNGTMALAGTMIVDLPELDLQAGTNGHFGLLLENDEAVSAGQFSFSYDSTAGFDVTGVSLTDRSAGFYEPVLFLKDESDPHNVEIFVLFFALDGSVIEAGNGVILEFSYQTGPDASGTLQPVLTDLLLVNEDGEALTAPPGGTPDTPSEPQDSYILSVTTTGSGSGSVTSQPAGIDCGGDCAEEYAAGTEVVLTATPDAGSIFVGWFGSCGGSEDCSVTMNANHSVEAIFDVLDAQYTIQAEAGEGGSISPAGAVSVERGASQLFTIAPQAGYEIEGVRIDGVSYGVLESYQFDEVFADRRIEVSFLRSDMEYSSIFNFDDDSHGWEDNNKSEEDPDDDWLCWAAAAANILAWTGWGTEIYDTAQEIFANLQENWTNGGGLMGDAWNWWFDGSIPDTQAGWASLNEGSSSTGGGGGYHADVDFFEYFYEDWASYDEDSALWGNGSGLMETVDQYVTQGFGTTLAVYNGLGGHALSVWGYEFGEDGVYSGVWVSDSDDYRTDLKLLSVNLDLDTNLWYLDAENRYNYNGWFIGAVQALEQSPSAPVPEPGTFLLFGLGLLLGIAVKRKSAKH